MDSRGVDRMISAYEVKMKVYVTAQPTHKDQDASQKRQKTQGSTQD